MLPIKLNGVPVTQPFLPPLEEFVAYLQQIWANKHITNNGPFHQQLEAALADYLGVKYVCLFSNGTLALITALQALGITGEAITSPYSFVATSHALIWNGIKPVFADIDKDTLLLDPAKIEAAITEHTTAIVPVHCYGYPCKVEAIQKIADKYKLKVIYDAAHAFGVQYKSSSVLTYGDLSILSFHATKVFNTFEGGAIICHNAEMKLRIDQLKNFGTVDEVTVVAAGINGKMSEVNAAMGLLQLQYMDEILTQRKAIDAQYRSLLSAVKHIDCLQPPEHTSAWNYSYFPILVRPGYPISRDALYTKMREQNIFPRRYFYPLISEFPMYRNLASSVPENLPVATEITQQILCLPIYPGLNIDHIRQVADIIQSQ
ncbi:DegT/DnrJ/EryC1/StrS family aminotransferase [Herbaspirillum lusitanum]|uniref:DegT/DnrJ/EryC1/StrS family aminotransferase n=1 Tax=Herbaspirillum lusitanum TaxID=213312 RepID=UPI00058E8E92|nr:DegT/DnrJ/EryC1/StrS family aminotransferase [Herbaspirillum lusitanum]